MFEFLDMIGNYESRKVANTKGKFEDRNYEIDTCYTSDTGLYETAISYDGFNDNNWMIVEQYKTKEKAEIGHKIWVKKLATTKMKEFKDIDVFFNDVVIRKDEF